MSEETRGHAIRQRRLALGIKSVRELAAASGVSREAVTAAENGQASAGTYDRLEAWLDSFEAETGHDVPQGGPVRFSVNGNFGVSVMVEGPVESIPDLEEAVERLIARLHNEPGQQQ